MTDTPMNILLVEDNADDARAVREMLANAPAACGALIHVDRLAHAVDRLADTAIDVVLLDLSLPDGHGLEAVVHLHAAAPHVPIVVMSDRDDESLALTGLQEGAQDYLVKGQVESGSLARALRYAIERQRVEERLSYLARHDTLTDLPNRVLLHDHLRRGLAHARRHGLTLALLFIDLDGFKEVNDLYGHDTGDRVLQEVARRLAICTREEDTVARFGGDEFAIILTGIKHDHDAAVVAQRILSLLAEPLSCGDHPIQVTASIGIGLYPSTSHDSETLIKSADTAMYRAKEQGKNGYAFFTADMTTQAYERLALERSLKQAIAQNGLLVHYQPIVATATDTVCRIEALARWPHPDQGLLLPNSFIALAEQTGLIVPLTYAVLETVLREGREWQRQGLRLDAAVNLSPRTLREPDLPERLAGLLHSYAMAPERLTVEVTESAIRAQESPDALTRLARLGVRIAIDDFGTDYSSPGHLADLPISEVKIDRSLVQGLTANVKNTAIVCSLIDMAHALGLQVVAEGVEDQAAYDLLVAVGCDAVQGYYVSHPLPAAELAQWLGALPADLGPVGV